MSKVQFIYESCCGEIYTSDELLTWEQCHCDICGDDDRLLFYGTKEEIINQIKEDDQGWHTDDFIDFVNSLDWSEDEDDMQT